jgi:peptidoglycan/LPS O-acetylase OafA/YrhL
MTAKLSYVLYLVHVMVIPGANVIVDAVLGTSDVPQLARLIIFLPIYAVCSLALGLAIHLAVERPFLKLKDRLV